MVFFTIAVEYQILVKIQLLISSNQYVSNKLNMFLLYTAKINKIYRIY